MISECVKRNRNEGTTNQTSALQRGALCQHRIRKIANQTSSLDYAVAEQIYSPVRV